MKNSFEEVIFSSVRLSRCKEEADKTENSKPKEKVCFA
jgi:hypothetical protein